MDLPECLRRRGHGPVPGRVWGAWGLALSDVGAPRLGHRKTTLSHAPVSREGARKGEAERQRRC